MRRVYVVEYRPTGELMWDALVSGARRKMVVAYRKGLIDKGDYGPRELRVVEYRPARSGKVDR